jgi:hypothetical protein
MKNCLEFIKEENLRMFQYRTRKEYLDLRGKGKGKGKGKAISVTKREGP